MFYWPTRMRINMSARKGSRTIIYTTTIIIARDMEDEAPSGDHSDNKVNEGKSLSSDETTLSTRKFWFKIISVHTASVLLIILVMASPNLILFLPFPWTTEQVL